MITLRNRTLGLALLLAFACCVTCNRARAQEERCGAGKDLVVQALERVTPSSSDDEFEDALQLLKHAVSTCGELGDAWYYRSLVEQRLGHASLAQYSWIRRGCSARMPCATEPIHLCLATPPAKRAFTANAPQQGAPVQRAHLQLRVRSSKNGR